MKRDHPNGAGATHARALERVGAASTERSRLRGEYERAKGTFGEVQADESLRAANEVVAARKRWLQWVEERDY